MKTILIVDDDESVRESIKDLLEAIYETKVRCHELRIMTAEGGRQAIEMCAAGSPDLLLMDVNMPEVDGIEAFTRILESRGGVPLRTLFITGYARDGLVHSRLDQAVADGALGYVLKPISSAELTDIVTRFVFAH